MNKDLDVSILFCFSKFPWACEQTFWNLWAIWARAFRIVCQFLHRKLIAACYYNRTKHTNILCGQNVAFFFIKIGAR
jgi:hypothetical protein